MKDFNEFIEYRKPLQRVMGSLNESDGIMLESMFYEFAKQQITKAKNLPIADVSKSFTYKEISKVAEELANQYSSDKKDPVWRDIRQDGIKAIQAFVSRHL